MRCGRLTLVFSLGLGTTVAPGCREQTSQAPTSLSHDGIGFAHAPAGSFGYFGDNGPAFWGSLDPAWGACTNGQVQSPVDLNRNLVRSRRHRQLDIAYGSTTGEIFNNTHTIEVETQGENVLTYDGVAYSLSQFHFHVLSEHTIEGEGHDMELHLVHASAAGTNAVVAVFLDRGTTSGRLTQIFEQLPDDFNVHHELDGAFNPADFLPDDRTHVRYLGSLTTPPCTDGVHWFVLTQPVTITSEDLAQFHERVHFNARPVQRSLP
jgi:carbonic anhydrase